MININKLVKCYDNGGKTLDQITVAFLNTKERSIFNSSKYSYECVSASYNGVSVYLHSYCELGRHLGKKIMFEDLHKDLQSRILDDLGIKPKTLSVNEFKRELKLNYQSDKWAEVLSAHFALCFEMHFRDFDIPNEWGFRSSPIGGDDQREEDDYYFDLFDGLSENDLLNIGNYLQRVENVIEGKYSY